MDHYLKVPADFVFAVDPVVFSHLLHQRSATALPTRLLRLLWPGLHWIQAHSCVCLSREAKKKALRDFVRETSTSLLLPGWHGKHKIRRLFPPGEGLSSHPPWTPPLGERDKNLNCIHWERPTSAFLGVGGDSCGYGTRKYLLREDAGIGTRCRCGGRRKILPIPPSSRGGRRRKRRRTSLLAPRGWWGSGGG